MTASRTEMTCFDHHRLTALIDRVSADDQRHFPDLRHLSALREKVEAAQCWEPADIPADVVTMGSTVLFREVDCGEAWTFTVCYPNEANIFEERISVLSPVGVALLGQRVGDVVDWPTPGGRVPIEIEQILYQPEAAEQWDEPELVLN